MMVHSVAARRYLNSIKREIPNIGRSKSKIVNIIREMVAEYLSENPDASYLQIENKFGTPAQIVSTYLAEAETSEIKKALNFKKQILIVMLIFTTLTFAAWVGVVSSALVRYYTNHNGFVIEQITDITTVPYQEGN